MSRSTSMLLRIMRTVPIVLILTLAAGCTNLPSDAVSAPEGEYAPPAAMSATFDPVDMAGPALEFLASNLECDGACVPRFHLSVDRGIESRHANWDYGDLMGRYVDGFFLLRTMTGSREHEGRERRLRRAWLDTFEKDGLTYRPDGPWSDREADVFDQSSSLIALATWYQFTGDAKVKQMIDRMVDRLLALAVHEPDGACRFAFPTYLPAGSEGRHRDNWQSADPAHHGGRLLVGLTGYLEAAPEEAAPDKPARRLADCLAKNVTASSGLFDPGRQPVFAGHMHSRTDTLVGLARLARIEGDPSLFRFVERIYAYAKSVGTQFGWFPEVVDPEHPDNPRARQAEGETTGDMIRLALLLAEGMPGKGIEQNPAYYDDAERFARNHFAESQLRAVPASVARGGDVGEAIGAVAGFARPNDWGTRTMNCCAGGATRAIYLLWSRQITRDEDGTVRVNLLMDGERHGLRVESRLPHEGVVELTASEPLSALVRIPGWIEETAVAIRSAPVPPGTVRETYLPLRLNAGETARVTFPVPRRTEKADTPVGRFIVTWAGDTIVRIDPPGEHIPLYRDRDAAPKAIEKRYFQPTRVPLW